MLHRSYPDKVTGSTLSHACDSAQLESVIKRGYEPPLQFSAAPIVTAGYWRRIADSVLQLVE